MKEYNEEKLKNTRIISKLIICLRKELIKIIDSNIESNLINIYYEKDVKKINNIIKSKFSSNVTLIGLYADFTNNKINKLLKSIKEETDPIINIVTGENYREIYYNLSKIFNKNSNKNKLFVLDRLFSYEKYNLVKILKNSYLENLIICAHSEGIHLNLLDVVICGLIENNEKDLQRNNIIGGCSVNYCRKAKEKNIKFIKAKDINVSSLYLLCCNGFTVNGELFNSKSNLISGFLNGKTKEILTTIRPYEVNSSIINLLKVLISDGLNLNVITWILNDIEYLKYRNTPFIAINGQNIFTYSYRFITLNKYYNLEKYKTGYFKIDVNINETIIIYECINSKNTEIFLGKNCFIILNQNNETIKFKVYDGKEEILNFKKYINLLLKKLNDKNYILTELVVKPNNIKYKDEITKCIKYIKDFITYLNKLFEYINIIYINKICDKKDLSKLMSYISLKENNLNKLLFKLFQYININKYIENILLTQYYKKFYLLSNKFKCARCNSYLEIYNLISSNDQNIERIMKFCPICGIRSISYSNINIDICIKNFTSELKVDIKSLINENEKNFEYQEMKEGYLLMDIIDKSSGNIYRQIKSYYNFNNDITINIKKDKHICSDIHSFRGIILLKFDMIYFHGKF